MSYGDLSVEWLASWFDLGNGGGVGWMKAWDVHNVSRSARFGKEGRKAIEGGSEHGFVDAR